MGDDFALEATEGLAAHLGISLTQARLVARLLPRRPTVRTVDEWADDIGSLPSTTCETWHDQAEATFVGAYPVSLTRDWGMAPREFSVIVWDRPPGHIVLAFEMSDEPDRHGLMQFPDEIGPAVARVLAPAWWPHARIFVPTGWLDYEEPLFARVELTGAPERLRLPARVGTVRRRRRAESRWRVAAQQRGVFPADVLAELLNGPVPVWPAKARTWQFVSDWAATLQAVDSDLPDQIFRRLYRGIRHLVKLDVPDRYPMLFGQIARVVLDELPVFSKGIREPGPHWEWAVRPSGAMPGEIAELLDTAKAATREQVPATEYSALLESADRAAGADVKEWQDAVSAIATAVREVCWPGHGVHVRTATGGGPLLQRWLDSLNDIEEERRGFHRVVELAKKVWNPERYCRDAHGRYVVVGRDLVSREVSIAAEWPTAGRTKVAQDAVVAADRPGEDSLVFVLHHGGSGLEIELLPATPHVKLGYGVGMGGGNGLYTSLVRTSGCEPQYYEDLRGDSELRKLLDSANGSLRVSWSWVREQVEADVRRADLLNERKMVELKREFESRRDRDAH